MGTGSMREARNSDGIREQYNKIDKLKQILYNWLVLVNNINKLKEPEVKEAKRWDVVC